MTHLLPMPASAPLVGLGLLLMLGGTGMMVVGQFQLGASWRRDRGRRAPGVGA